MEDLIVFNNEVEEKDFFEKLFSNDDEAVYAFYKPETPKKREKLKVPTIEKMNGALKDKILAFTHSNRLIEPRVETGTFSEFSKAGDVNAFSEGLEGMVDISGVAKHAPVYHVMLTDYIVDNKKTNLFQAILSKRMVSSLFSLGISFQDFSLANYDKRVLIPDGEGSYVVAFPRTPAWRTVAIMNAQKQLFKDEFLELKPDLGAESFVLSTKLRISEILNGVNASYFTGKKTTGNVYHSVFLPPKRQKGLTKRILKLAEKNGIKTSYLLYLIDDVVSESGLINLIAKEIHKVSGVSDIKNISAPDNAMTRSAYERLGSMCYQAIGEMMEFDTEDLSFTFFINENIESIVELCWNKIYYKIPKHYVFNGAKDIFIKNFNDSFNLFSAVENKDKTSFDYVRKNEGSFLKIKMSVDGYDAGSNGFSLGPLQPVAIYGWLHNLLERKIGLEFNCFTPVYSNIFLNDQSCIKTNDKMLITKQTFDENKELILESLKTENGFDVSWIYNIPERTMNTRSGSGDRCGFFDKGTTGSSMRLDVQASAVLTVLIELKYPLSSSEADDVIKRIEKEIVKTRLNGGIIRVKDIGIYSKEPRVSGFSLKRKEVKNVKEWLKNISFINSDYIGEAPVGLLAVGYDSVESCGEFCYNNESYSSGVVETVYKGFSFVRSSNREKVWFYPNFESKDVAGFCFTLL